mgnify:CR=1 FL=1
MNRTLRYITLAVALSRGDRVDTTVQKATELGVREIWPFTSERTGVRLDGERIGLLAGSGIAVCRLVLAGEGAGKLVGVEALEVTRGREMVRLALVTGKRLVRHLPQELLGEGVLPALRRPRVSLEHQDLPAHEAT